MGFVSIYQNIECRGTQILQPWAQVLKSAPVRKETIVRSYRIPTKDDEKAQILPVMRTHKTFS